MLRAIGYMVCVAAAGAGTMIVPQSLAAQECVQCINVGPCSQDCALGGGSDHCVIFYEMGCRWCNMVGSCEDPGGLRKVKPTDLTPAGTYAAAFGVVVRDRGVVIQPCTGFIISYTPIDPNPAGHPAPGVSLGAEQRPSNEPGRRERVPTVLVLSWGFHGSGIRPLHGNDLGRPSTR